MFKKLLTVGVLAAALVGGVGTASAYGTQYNCQGGQTVEDQVPRDGLEMWVVHSTRTFANDFKKFKRKWYFQGSILRCERNGKTYYAAFYKGQWIK
ncbi:hypothetical protein [Photorhabdus akhurstii]|uniref:hypothetical protein n=1 Tax=Photorhabdus akhurstii TaxID=171438 RepID=UPI0037045F05